MGNTIKVSRAIVPKDVDNGEVLQVHSQNFKEGFSEGEGGVNDNMDGDDGKGRIYFSPLEIMFRANLNGRRGSEAEGNNRVVNGTVSKLSFSPIDLRGPQLPVRPPVVLVG